MTLDTNNNINRGSTETNSINNPYKSIHESTTIPFTSKLKPRHKIALWFKKVWNSIISFFKNLGKRNLTATPEQRDSLREKSVRPIEKSRGTLRKISGKVSLKSRKSITVQNKDLMEVAPIAREISLQEKAEKAIAAINEARRLEDKLEIIKQFRSENPVLDGQEWDQLNDLISELEEGMNIQDGLDLLQKAKEAGTKKEKKEILSQIQALNINLEADHAEKLKKGIENLESTINIGRAKNIVNKIKNDTPVNEKERLLKKIKSLQLDLEKIGLKSEVEKLTQGTFVEKEIINTETSYVHGMEKLKDFLEDMLAKIPDQTAFDEVQNKYNLAKKFKKEAVKLDRYDFELLLKDVDLIIQKSRKFVTAATDENLNAAYATKSFQEYTQAVLKFYKHYEVLKSHTAVIKNSGCKDEILPVFNDLLDFIYDNKKSYNITAFLGEVKQGTRIDAVPSGFTILPIQRVLRHGMLTVERAKAFKDKEPLEEIVKRVKGHCDDVNNGIKIMESHQEKANEALKRNRYDQEFKELDGILRYYYEKGIQDIYEAGLVLKYLQNLLEKKMKPEMKQNIINHLEEGKKNTKLPSELRNIYARMAWAS